MIRAVILFLAFVVIYAAAGDGNWGTVGVTAVITLLLMLMSSVERRDVKAWNNRQEYWAKGGPERYRK